MVMLLGLIAAPTTARAQDLKVLKLELIQPKAGEPTKKGEKKAKPVYRAKVDFGVPGLGNDAFKLKAVDAEPLIEADAVKVTTFPESTDKLALVVLVQGDEMWIGNEGYVADDDADQLQGAFSALPDAVDALSKAGPAGSQGALVIFGGGGATVKGPPGELGKLAGALGTQQDYKGVVGSPLVVGIDAAYKLLTEMRGRKVLVVIGNGVGQSDDLNAQVEERVKKLEAARIESFSIYFAVEPTENPVPKAIMRRIGYSGDFVAKQRDNFTANAGSIVAKLSARYYLDFPAEPFATPDKTTRELTLFVNDEESDPVDMATIQLKKPPEESSLWWLWLLISLVAGVGIIALIVKLKNREPAPPPIIEAPPEPVAEAAPAKTVMLGLGGNDDGFPIVGWIVPLTGPHQYQTFKLLQGSTTIGTAGDSNIVVDDSFMSTQHAEIACTPVGFILKDAGSTNGMFVNQKQVQAHELVDNDVFTLGKTDFKFKSIN